MAFDTRGFWAWRSLPIERLVQQGLLGFTGALHALLTWKAEGEGHMEWQTINRTLL